MKEIKLTQGKIALVDDDDFEWLNQWKWHYSKTKTSSCVRRSVWKNPDERMHRLIMGLKSSDKREVDHINGNPLDNRRENLRICNKAQNQWNAKIRKDNKTGFRGVRYRPEIDKYISQIKLNKQCYYLGCYSNKIDAAIAYNNFAIKHRGSFAKINIVPSEAPNDPKA
jgi:hypothetical protein